MMITNGINLTTIQDLVPMFIIPVIPENTMSLSTSYQRHNTRPPASHFQMMWPSPRVVLTMNYSSIYWNLTPANLTTIMDYPAVVPFGPNYIYATIHHLIYRSLSISAIIPVAYTTTYLVRYCTNGLSGRNRPVDVKKLRKFSLFKPDNIVMKTLEATTQLGGFNKRLLMRKSNNRFP